MHMSWMWKQRPLKDKPNTPMPPARNQEGKN